MAKMRRISPQELQRKFDAERKADERRESSKQLYGPDGKKMNSRKKRGAKKTIMETAILNGLMKDGFIVKQDDGSFFVDLSARIEDTYPGDTVTYETIREILKRTIRGLESNGAVVETKHILSGVIGESGIQSDRRDSEGRDDSGSVQRESPSGVRSGGRESDQALSQGNDSEGGDSDGEDEIRVQDDDPRSEGE